MRVEKAKTNDVESLVDMLLEIGARVIDDSLRAWVAVRMFRVPSLTNCNDRWVDVDADDAAEAAAQRCRNIISRSCSDDERAVPSLCEPKWNVVRHRKLLQCRPVANRQISTMHASKREVMHQLMEIAIDRHLNRSSRVGIGSGDVDPVIR